MQNKPLRYSRYDDSDPLEHGTRTAVFEAIQNSPGAQISRVSEQSGVSMSTIRHHIRILENEDLIERFKARGRQRMYPAGDGIERKELELSAALQDEATARIFDRLARLGQVSVTDLATELDRDESTLTYHLQRLEEGGLVVRERDGQSMMNHISSPAYEALASIVDADGADRPSIETEMRVDENRETVPKARQDKRGLDIGAQNPAGSNDESASKVPSKTTCMIERFFDKYGDPTVEADTSTDPTDDQPSTWSYSDFIADILPKKYVGEIILVIGEQGPIRWGNIKNQVREGHPSSIPNRINELHVEGIVERTSYDEVPPRVEYSLAPKGERLYAELAKLDPGFTEAFVGKYAIPIIWGLGEHESVRFMDILGSLDTASGSTVSDHLKKLIGEGVVNRTSYNEMSQTVEYSLTDCGRELYQTMRELGFDIDKSSAIQPTHPSSPSQKISSNTCEKLRKLVKEGLSAVASRDELGLDVGTSSIYRHVKGNCSCETEVPEQTFITHTTSPDVCGELRQLAEDDFSAQEAIEELGLDISKSVVYTHASGDCTCETDVPPNRFGSISMSAEECGNIRRQLRSGVDLAAGNSSYSRSDVERHGSGDCIHDIDEPPVKTTTKGASLPAEMCHFFNRLYNEELCHTGQIRDKTQEQFQKNVDEVTIKDHLLGECDHPP